MRGKVVIGIAILIALLFSSLGFGFSSTNAGDSTKNNTTMRDLNRGLVAYWNFDEGSGNILHDVSGNGNDGTIYGATWVNGIHGKALSFDGSNSYVTIPSRNIPPLASITITAWIRMNNTYGIQQILERDTNTDTLEIEDGKVSHWNVGLLSKKTILPGVWYFIAAMYNNTSKQAYIYINDTMDSYKSYDGNLGSGTGVINIGRDPDAYSQYFYGLIDEVRIYNRDLSPQEIKELYEQYSNNQRGNGMNYLWYIIAGVVAAAIIATALIMFKRKGEKPQPQGHYENPPQYQYPQQVQQPPPQQTQPPPSQQSGYPPPPPSQGAFVNKTQPPPQSMGTITVTCPYCGFTSQMPENMRGQWVQCPKCGNQFRIP